MITLGLAHNIAYNRLFPNNRPNKGSTIGKYLKSLDVLFYTNMYSPNKKQYLLSYNKANICYTIEDMFYIDYQGNTLVIEAYIKFVCDIIIPDMIDKHILHNDKYLTPLSSL